MGDTNYGHKCIKCYSLDTVVVGGVSDGIGYYDYVDCRACGAMFEQDVLKKVAYLNRDCEFNGKTMIEISC